MKSPDLSRLGTILALSITFSAVALVPFLWRALDQSRRVPVCLAVSATAMLGVVTSGSRAALVVVIVLALLVPALERSVPAALSVAAAGIVAFTIIPQRSSSDGQDALSRLLGGGDASGSNALRVEGVEKSLHTAFEHPFFGVGFSFIDFGAHNMYVQVAVAVGFIGALAFVGVVLSMMGNWLAHKDVHSRLAYPAAVFLIAGPVSPNLTDRYVGLLLGLSLVGSVAVHRRRREHPVTVEDQVRSSST